MPPFVAQSRNSPERMQPSQSSPVKASFQVGRGEHKPNVVRILTSWQVMFLPPPPSNGNAPRQLGNSPCYSATSAGGQPGRPDATFEAREHRLAAPSFRKGVAARAHPSRPYPNVYRRVPAGRDAAPLPRLPARQFRASPRRRVLRGDAAEATVAAATVFASETSRTTPQPRDGTGARLVAAEMCYDLA